MTCPSCGTPNPAESRFCLECGTPLGGCPSCGTVNPPGAKFCGNCGTRLAPASSPAPGVGAPAAGPGASTTVPLDPAVAVPLGAATGPAGHAVAAGHAVPAAPGTPWDATATTERRMVSVLFADLVGFTALSSTRDPETVREIQDRYFERTSEIIGRYGGTVEKFIGDAVMAMWGAPVAHEDDAERAVRAALDLVDMVPTIGREAGVDLQLRAGVLTGEAAVGLGAEGQGMVTGDMVNTASRLQSVAAPGTVLVGADTRLASESAVAFEPAGEQVLKGKAAPVPSWRAVRVLAERGGARRPDALEPPFVGRAEELRFLKEQFHATGREQRARLISLVGQAGIGKTRLAWELEKYLDGVVENVYWHRGRAPSYGEGVTFWALSEMIRRRAGLVEGADPETTRSAVAAMVAQHVPDAGERSWIEPRLNTLLGVGEPVSGGHEELFAAWRTFFERLAAGGTVALVIEDLQWSDDGLLDFLEHLLDWARTSPIFVLTLARPELLERRPGWGSDRRGAISMRLEPLTDDAIRELLDGLVPGLPEGIVRRVVERADGIPLYAVETVRMLQASGRLVEQDGRLRISGSITELEVPPTLHALVAARLDGLAPADRSLLQDAAVLGQSFTTEALSAMTGESTSELAPRLASLVRREVLTIETDPRAPTRGQYAFVQGLVREVAYSTLSRRERRTRHLTAARYFETIVDEELAGAVATHFVAAYRAAPDGPEGEAVGNQARIALMATADRAERLGALAQAIDALRQAAEVSRDPTERAGILERLGWIATEASRIDESVAALDQAISLFEEAGDRVGVVRATASLVLGYQAASRIAEAEERAAAIEAEGEALVNAVVDAGPKRDRTQGETAAIFAEAVGRLRFRQQRFDDSIAWCDRALQLAGPLRLDAVIAQALTTKGTALHLGGRGRTREGTALLQGALLDARSHGEHLAALRAINNLASFLVGIDPRAALERVQEGLELAHRLGYRAFDSYLIGNSAGAGKQTGDWDLVVGWATEMLEDVPDREDGQWIRFCQDLASPWRGSADAQAVKALLADAQREHDAQTEANVLSAMTEVSWVAGRTEEAADHAAARLALDLPAFASDRAGVALLEAGRLDQVRQLLERLAEDADGSSDLQRATLEAGLLAVEGQRQEAVQLFRSSVSGLRELGCRFSVALAIVDMLTFLGPDEPAVRSLLPEGREILVDLKATAVLERFDALAGSAGSDRAPAPARTDAAEVGVSERPS